MTLRLRLTTLLFGLAGLCRADLAPASDLLPTNTLAVLSVPDVSAAQAAWSASNPGRLWQDPAMAAFRNRFETSFRQKWLGVLERESGLDLRELLGLTRGQATLAVLPPLAPEPGSDESAANWILLMDARGGSAELAKALEAARARLGTNAPAGAPGGNQANAKPEAEAGSKTTNRNPVETRQIGEHRFTRVTLDLQTAAASAGAPSAAPGEALEDEDLRWELCYGQVGSAFVAGPSWAAISNALPRLTTTNAVAGLATKPSFGRLWNSTLKDRVIWSYVDVASLFERLAPRLEGVFGMLSLLGADPAKVVPATGLTSIKAIGAGVQAVTNGWSTELAFEVPASERAGLTRVMELLPLEAGLLEGVPESVASYQRWRIDGPAGWKALEASLKRISPKLSELARITVESAGQVFDPNFNLQRDLVGGLGNDFVTITLPPSGTNLMQLGNPGRIQMVGSPNPARLVSGWKALEALVHMQAGALEFSQRTGAGGRPVVVATVGGKGGTQNAFQLTTSSNHVVIANDAAAMDAYLAAASRGVPTVPGLAESAAGAGGTRRGMFGFSQPQVELRSTWETLRTSQSLAAVMPPGTTSLETVQTVESWADFKLLPPFETIAKYWTLQAISGGTDADGFRFHWFSPKAP